MVVEDIEVLSPIAGNAPDGTQRQTQTEGDRYMDAAQIELANRVLKMIASRVPVPFDDAIRLRHWAILPKDSTLPLAEIARKIIESDEIPA